MPQLIIVTRDGTEQTVEGRVGWSVMENIRDNGFDELLALCGGCCSCATCHVHVDPEWIGTVGPPKADEDDLLDTSDHRIAHRYGSNPTRATYGHPFHNATVLTHHDDTYAVLLEVESRPHDPITKLY